MTRQETLKHSHSWWHRRYGWKVCRIISKDFNQNSDIDSCLHFSRPVPGGAFANQLRTMNKKTNAVCLSIEFSLPYSRSRSQVCGILNKGPNPPNHAMSPTFVQNNFTSTAGALIKWPEKAVFVAICGSRSNLDDNALRAVSSQLKTITCVIIVERSGSRLSYISVPLSTLLTFWI